MRNRGILFGRATVPPHADGGWALPGQEQTYSEAAAIEMAARIDAEITRLDERRQPVKAVAPRSITRRSVAESVAVARSWPPDYVG